MSSTKIRLSAALSVVAAVCLTLSGCGLIGDGSCVDDAEMQELFGSQDGVASVSTYCRANLPLLFSCDVDVVIDDDSRDTDVASLIEIMRDSSINATLTISTLAEGDQHIEVNASTPESAADSLLIATTFLTAARFEPAGTVSYEATAESSLVAEYPSATATEILDRSRTLRALDASSAMELANDSFTLSVDSGSYPQAEVGVFEAIAEKYPLDSGVVQADYVSVTVVDSASLQAARSYAANLEGYDSIALVDITDVEGSDFSDVNPADAAAYRSVLDSALAVPGVVSATAGYGGVSVVVPAVADVRRVDTALLANADYRGTRIRFAVYGDGDVVSRDAGESLPLDVFERLVASGTWEDVSLTAATDGLAVDVDTFASTDPYDVGYSLAASGVGRFPGGTVVFGARDDNQLLYSMAFTIAGKLDVPTDTFLTGQQSDEIERGWAAGL